MESTIRERVIKTICDETGVKSEECIDSADLQSDLCLDSLDLVELVMKLEDDFGVNIDDDTALKIKTVGDVINEIDKLVAKKLS